MSKKSGRAIVVDGQEFKWQAGNEHLSVWDQDGNKLGSYGFESNSNP